MSWQFRRPSASAPASVDTIRKMLLCIMVGASEAYALKHSPITTSHTMRSSVRMLIAPGDVGGEDFRHGTGRAVTSLRQMGGTDPLALETEQTAPINYASSPVDDFRYGKGSVTPVPYGGTAPIGQEPVQDASPRQVSIGSDDFRFGARSAGVDPAPLGGTGTEGAKKTRASPAFGTVDDFRYGRGSVYPTSYGGA